MLVDFLRQNYAALIGWVVLSIILFVLAKGIKKAIKTLPADADTAAYANMDFKWLWKIYFTVSILGLFVLVGTQSINYIPRNTEDRTHAESDQQKFEQRVDQFNEQKRESK